MNLSSNCYDNLGRELRLTSIGILLVLVEAHSQLLLSLR